MREKWQSYTNFLGVLFLSMALLLALCIEIFRGQEPCVLCLLQRLAVSGICLGLYLNLSLGVSPKHYGFSLLWALFGELVSLKHMSLNVCEIPESPPFFFFSCRLYTWAFVLFFLSMLAISILLVLYKPSKERLAPFLRHFAFGCVLFLLLMASGSVFLRIGFGV